MGHLFSRTKTLRILLHTHAADDKTKATRPLLNSFAIYSVYVDSGIVTCFEFLGCFFTLLQDNHPPPSPVKGDFHSSERTLVSGPHLRLNCTHIDLILGNVCSRVHVNFLLAYRRKLLGRNHCRNTCISF